MQLTPLKVIDTMLFSIILAVFFAALEVPKMSVHSSMFAVGGGRLPAFLTAYDP